MYLYLVIFAIKSSYLQLLSHTFRYLVTPLQRALRDGLSYITIRIKCALPLLLDIDGASDDDHNDEQDGATHHTRQEDYWNNQIRSRNVDDHVLSHVRVHYLG